MNPEWAEKIKQRLARHAQSGEFAGHLNHVERLVEVEWWPGDGYTYRATGAAFPSRDQHGVMLLTFHHDPIVWTCELPETSVLSRQYVEHLLARAGAHHLQEQPLERAVQMFAAILAAEVGE